jgi:hypothetical protein
MASPSSPTSLKTSFKQLLNKVASAIACFLYRFCRLIYDAVDVCMSGRDAERGSRPDLFSG